MPVTIYSKRNHYSHGHTISLTAFSCVQVVIHGQRTLFYMLHKITKATMFCADTSRFVNHSFRGKLYPQLPQLWTWLSRHLTGGKRATDWLVVYLNCSEPFVCLPEFLGIRAERVMPVSICQHCQRWMG